MKCPEIGAELFQWFVDTIRHVKARVGNDILIAKAKQILLDEKKWSRIWLPMGRSLKTKYRRGQRLGYHG